MFELSEVFILGLFICFMIIIFYVLALTTSSCGGREQCGKKYCIVGIIMDSMDYLVLGIKLLILLEFGIIIVFILDL